jgi:hypothetical protein
MKISVRAQILLLVLVVLGIYYPANLAGFNSVDDLKMVARLEAMSGVDFSRIFLPGQNFYYRPLLRLSFIADKYLWSLQPSFMHLENVILHALNTLLVFFVARRIFARFNAAPLYLPLLSAILFALHPINTESVNWISGRTDLLGTFFVLLSLLALVEGLESGGHALLFLLASLLLGLGAMSKEVMIFFLPVGVLLIWCWPGEAECRRSVGLRLRQAGIFAAPFVILGCVYLACRFNVHGRGDAGLRHLMHGYSNGGLDSVRIFFKVGGFYFKKLFIPLPLNFAIIRISDLYVWVGVAALFGLLLAAARFRRNAFFLFFLAAVLLFTPAILIALMRVAWTPVAERYLYLPSAFFSVAIVGLLWQALQRQGRVGATIPLLLLLLLPTTAVTADRNLTWQNNLRLFEDTREKSPDFSNIGNELAAALIARGEYSSAEEQLESAKAINTGSKNLSLYINHAVLKVREGKFEEARTLLLEVCPDKGTARPDLLKTLARIDEERMAQAPDEVSRKALADDLVDTYSHLHRKTSDVFYLYRSGQLLLAGGDRVAAGDCFARVAATAPASAYYKEAAGKLAAKLRTE